MPTPDPNPSTGDNGSDKPGVLKSIAASSVSSVQTLVDRVRFALHAGITFGGKRDTYKALGFPRKIFYEDYRDRFERGGIARRLVRALPNDIWSSNIQVTEDTDSTDLENKTAFDKQYLELTQNTGIDFIGKMRRADILASVGRYSVILIGSGDVDLKQPLSGLEGLKSLLYLKVYSEDRAVVKRIIGDGQGNAQENTADKTDPRFGRPATYSLKFSEISAEDVHWSRIIHVARDLLEDDVFGTPVLKAVWNLLDSLDKIWGAGPEAIWKNIDKGNFISIDEDQELSEPEILQMMEQLKAFEHDLNKNILFRKGKLTPLSSPVAEFASSLNAVLRLIAGTVGIPLRILVGSEQGELASTQDRSNYQDRKDEETSLFAEPLMRSVLDRFGEIGIMNVPDLYSVIWPQIEDLTAAETGDVIVKMATANKRNQEAGAGIIVTSTEIRKDVMRKDPLSDEDSRGLIVDDEEGSGHDDDNNDDDDNNNDSGDSDTDDSEDGNSNE